MPYAAGSNANRKERPEGTTPEVPDWQWLTRRAKWSASCFEPSHRSPAAPRETIATARHSSNSQRRHADTQGSKLLRSPGGRAGDIGFRAAGADSARVLDRRRHGLRVDGDQLQRLPL